VTDVCLDVVKCSSYPYSCSFSPILIKLGTNVLLANVHKSLEQLFQILLLKFLVNFISNLDLDSGTAAAELSRLTGLPRVLNFSFWR